MSTAKISRAVGVPFAVVEQWQKFLGATPYQRVSKLVRYQHLIRLIPIGLLAKLAGVSISRASEFRNKVLAEKN